MHQFHLIKTEVGLFLEKEPVWWFWKSWSMREQEAQRFTQSLQVTGQPEMLTISLPRQKTEAVRQSGLLPRLTAVTYVPMPPERERHRGYNQSKLLAQYLAGELGLPLREGVLARDGRATAHAAAGRAARITLAKESYRAGERKLPPGEHILLIDDIITTGATLENCAALLLAQGAESVTAAAVLRTPRPEGKKLEGNKG